MRYINILGRQPEFGLAELETMLGSNQVEPFAGHALCTRELNVNELGGTIKIGKIVSRLSSSDHLPSLHELLPLKPGKNTIGVSVYGHGASHTNTRRLAMQLKKNAPKGSSLRMVLPQNNLPHLNVAQVKFNKLASHGHELLVIYTPTETIYALTQQIEDIDWYSRRDFIRPARDTNVGMLPPKLAQIIINCAGPGPIFDPFCGTGVILQEALLMKRDAAGSDIESKMVQATLTNLRWLGQEQTLSARYTTEQADATSVRIPVGYTIASEGYLGPNLATLPPEKRLNKILNEADILYRLVLKNFSAQQQSNQRLCLAVPAWFGEDQNYRLPLIDHLDQIGYTFMDFAHINARELIYRRPGQTTARQLLILRKL